MVGRPRELKPLLSRYRLIDFLRYTRQPRSATSVLTEVKRHAPQTNIDTCSMIFLFVPKFVTSMLEPSQHKANDNRVKPREEGATKVVNQLTPRSGINLVGDSGFKCIIFNFFNVSFDTGKCR